MAVARGAKNVYHFDRHRQNSFLNDENRVIVITRTKQKLTCRQSDSLNVSTDFQEKRSLKVAKNPNVLQHIQDLLR